MYTQFHTQARISYLKSWRSQFILQLAARPLEAFGDPWDKRGWVNFSYQKENAKQIVFWWGESIFSGDLPFENTNIYNFTQENISGYRDPLVHTDRQTQIV